MSPYSLPLMPHLLLINSQPYYMELIDEFFPKMVIKW